MKFDTIYLDLDGTLLKSHIGILNGIRYAVKELGLTPMDESEMMRFIGPPIIQSFQRICGLSPDRATEAVRVFREYYNRKGNFESELYDGVFKTLKELKEKGYRLSIATAKPKYMAEKIAAHKEIAHFFDHIEGARADGHLDKKAELLAYMVEHYLDGDAGRTVMVGDRHYDLLGARQVGMASIGVTWGYGSLQEIKDCQSDAIADTPEQIITIMEKMNEDTNG